MPITKEKKKDIITGLSSDLKGANSIVFVHFKKLPVKDTTELRRKLRSQKVSYKVAKKTLMKRTLDGFNFTGEMPVLDGEIAMAYGDDLLSPAREVYEFQKTHKDGLAIVGGVFDGKYMDQVSMMSIATIPPIQVLYGQFVNLINSPIQGLVLALNAIAEKKA